MQKITLFILLNLSFLSLIFGQSDCETNSVVYEYYERDIKHLSIIEMIGNNAPELEYAEISESYQLPIWEGLSAIFNSNLPGRDEVFDIYCIHHLGNINNSQLVIYQTMYVNPEPNVSWIQSWEAGDLTTYDEEFNAFLQRWGFYYDGKLLNSFKLKTDQLINMIPLADTVDMMDSIIFAERKSHIGYGNAISFQKNGNDRYYTFSVGWGDCPSGCVFNHNWSFLVTEDCEVSFLGESGADDIPEYLKIDCNISTITQVPTILEAEVKIYPNPVLNYLTVSTDGAETENLDLEIRNIHGEKLIAEKYNNDISINTDNLPNGVYFVLLKDGESIVSIKKIVKK